MAPAEIDIHLLHMDGDFALAPLVAVLPAAEIDQACRFRNPLDRRRYLARHGWLRRRLAPYAGVDPQDLRFRLNPFGKPSLSEGPVQFSLSHSDGYALLAVALDRPVGCDIERRDDQFPHREVGRQAFTSREARALDALPAHARARSFFTRWTCKEAYVKACGIGLSLPFDCFEVDVDGDRARLGEGCGGWSVAAFEPVVGFQAAVVTRGAGWRLRRVACDQWARA
jgi:4'-phosphopantetheinyl transferase